MPLDSPAVDTDQPGQWVPLFRTTTRSKEGQIIPGSLERGAGPRGQIGNAGKRFNDATIILPQQAAGHARAEDCNYMLHF
jgi:hypothetical protein